MNEQELLRRAHRLAENTARGLYAIQRWAFALEMEIGKLRGDIEDYWEDHDAPPPDRRGIQ